MYHELRKRGIAAGQLNVAEAVDAASNCGLITVEVSSSAMMAALDASAGSELGAPVNRRLLQLAGAGIEHRTTRARSRLARPFLARGGETAFRRRAHRHHPAQDLDLDSRDRAAVEPAVGGLEQLGDGRSDPAR